MSDRKADSGFEPVEFWNPVYPNENLTLHVAGTDPAAAPVIAFAAGYFRATEPWQVEAIEKNLSNRVFRADGSNDLICSRCGWTTKSVEAFNYHSGQHG